MVGNSESCLCLDNNSSVEFACSCNDSIIFLCNKCIADHVREPSSHTFISIAQARDQLSVQTSSASKQQADQINQSFASYISKITEFISSINSFKPKLIETIEESCKVHIDFLENLLAVVSASHFEILKTSADGALSPEICAKFDSEGLAGLISDYYSELRIHEEDVMKSVKNMIYFGNEAKGPSRESIQDKIENFSQIVETLKKENEELKSELSLHLPQPIYDTALIEERKDLNYDDLKMRFEYSMKDKALVEYDKLLKSHRKYDLKQFIQISDNQATCVLLPDRRVIIIGTNNAIYRYDPTTDLCMRLQGLNEYRQDINFICHGNYLYAIGGTFNGCRLKNVERMDWRKNGWEYLKNSIEGTDKAICFSIDNSIYIIQGYKMQRYDILENKFYVVPNLRSPLYHGKVREIDGLIFILSSSQLTVMCRSLNFISRFDNIQMGGCLNCVNKGDLNRCLIFSFEGGYIRFHRGEEKNFKIYKKVLFI
jgi:hypothetical protein